MTTHVHAISADRRLRQHLGWMTVDFAVGPYQGKKHSSVWNMEFGRLENQLATIPRQIGEVTVVDVTSIISFFPVYGFTRRFFESQFFLCLCIHFRFS